MNKVIKSILTFLRRLVRSSAKTECALSQKWEVVPFSFEVDFFTDSLKGANESTCFHVGAMPELGFARRPRRLKDLHDPEIAYGSLKEDL